MRSTPGTIVAIRPAPSLAALAYLTGLLSLTQCDALVGLEAPSTDAGDDAGDAAPDVVAVCSAGQFQCSADQPQRCVNGTWVNEGPACQAAAPCCGGSCASGPCLLQLAAGTFNPDGIAVDSSNVYWTESTTAPGLAGAVVKVPIGGGATTVLAAMQGYPTSIAVGTSQVFWIDSMPSATTGALLTIPAEGGVPVTLSLFTGSGGALALDATSVYFTDTAAGAVLKVSRGGGTPVTLAMQQYLASAIAVDQANVYWASLETGLSLETGNIWATPLGGGDVSLVGDANEYMFPASLAADSNALYWTNPGAGTVMSYASGQVTTVASGQGEPTGIALDATSVYWTNSASLTVMKVSRDGGSPMTLASDQNGPNAIAVDETSVYWTTNNGGPNSCPADAGCAQEGSVMKLTPK